MTIWLESLDMFCSITVRLAHAVVAGVVVLGSLVQAAAAENLYRAQTTVTGQGEENRLGGIERCFVDVLIKVSGSTRLANDSKVIAHMLEAGTFVESFAYIDQMSGTPKRDEQGTRDRPYDLIVDFDRDKINGLLFELNVLPWLSPRPVIAVVVRMNAGGATFPVSNDSRRSELQKEALLAAASKRGLQIVLPDAASLEKLDRSHSGMMLGRAVTAELGAKVTLVGQLTWVDPELKWRADWRLLWQGRLHHWQVGATTFDEVFRLGLGDTLEILARNH
jgi:hypothetical protein